MKDPYGPVGCVLKYHSLVTVSHIIWLFFHGEVTLVTMESRDQRKGGARLSYLRLGGDFGERKKPLLRLAGHLIVFFFLGALQVLFVRQKDTEAICRERQDQIS